MNNKPEGTSKLFGADGRIIRKTVVLFISIGLVTFIIAIGAIFGGKALDQRLGTAPWLMVGLGILGICLAMGLTLLFTMRSLRSIQTFLNEKENKGTHQ